MHVFQRQSRTAAMPVIDIHRTHAGSIASTKTAIERVAKGISAHYGVVHQWIGDELHFTRSGVKGRITVASKDVHVRVDLGVLMGAMKPIIEREISRQLDEHLV
ncbi:MAG: polyhydroxyalkanoic acid system family protein [Dokdonella sp.]